MEGNMAEAKGSSRKRGYELLLNYPSLKQLMRPGTTSDSDDESLGEEEDDDAQESVDVERLYDILLKKLFLASLSVAKLAAVPEDIDSIGVVRSSPDRLLTRSPVLDMPVLMSPKGSPSGRQQSQKRHGDVHHLHLEFELRNLKKRASSPVKGLSASIDSPTPNARKNNSSSPKQAEGSPILANQTSSPLRRAIVLNQEADKPSASDSPTLLIGASRGGAELPGRQSTPVSSRNPDTPGVEKAEYDNQTQEGSSLEKSEKVVVLKTKKKKKAIAFYDRQSAVFMAQEVKRETLLELVAFVRNKGFELLPDQNVFLQAAMDMVRKNLFRHFAPPPMGIKHNEMDWDDDTPILDPRWPHLSVVYEFFNLLLEIKSFPKGLLSGTFCSDFVALFTTEDPRERDSLKTSLHRIYGAFPAIRPAIRKEIQLNLERSVNERIRISGIPELLEVYGSICSGFTTPLKKEHLEFFKNGLLPLHRSDAISSFHNELCYCVTQYVGKDPTALVEVVRALRKYFPLNAAQKQVLFLNELEESVEIALRADTTLIGSHALRKLLSEPDLKSLFDDIASIVEDALLSEHFQVCERALFLWNNDFIANHIFKSSAPRMQGVFVAIENDRSHWNPTVCRLADEVASLYCEDPYYEEAISGHNAHSTVSDRKRRADMVIRAKFWDEIAKAAALNTSSSTGSNPNHV